MQASTLSLSEDSEDDEDDRKERHMVGNVEFNVYQAFFKAARSKTHVIVVLIIFIAAQCTYSGADFFISQWYVILFSLLIAVIHFSILQQFIRIGLIGRRVFWNRTQPKRLKTFPITS